MDALKLHLAADLYSRCMLMGDFKLRSGDRSNIYFDKYRFESDPCLMQQVVDAIAKAYQGMLSRSDFLAGLEMGGIPLAALLSQRVDRPTLFVRKEAKTYGTAKLVEGTDFRVARVIIIEDVITRGSSVVDAVYALRDGGAIVSDVIAVVDRQQGADAMLEKHGMTLHALFTLKQLGEAALSYGIPIGGKRSEG